MLRLFTKYRRTAALGLALLASFLLMTFQTRQQGDLVLPIKRALVASITPALRLTNLITTSASHLWQGYLDLRKVRQENLRLREEISSLKERFNALQESALEGKRLRSLLELKEETRLPLKAARVIGADSTNWFRTIFINKGSEDGIGRNMPVLSPEGIVGRVVEVMPRAAKVQLVTDPSSSIAALIQRSRVMGLVTGELGTRARMRYLPLMAEVEVGDRVVTSGLGGVFPKGIPVGKIERVDRKGGSFFQEARMSLSVDFSHLEEVLVLTTVPSAEVRWLQGKEQEVTR